MQGRSQPLFSHLSPICKSPLGNGGGGGSEISGYGIKRSNVLDHYTGLDMIFFKLNSKV